MLCQACSIATSGHQQHPCCSLRSISQTPAKNVSDQAGLPLRRPPGSCLNTANHKSPGLHGPGKALGSPVAKGCQSVHQDSPSIELPKRHGVGGNRLTDCPNRANNTEHLRRETSSVAALCLGHSLPNLNREPPSLLVWQELPVPPAPPRKETGAILCQ